MNVREWALITFTILVQMSVGSFVVLGVLHFFAARKAGEAEADRLTDRALLAIGPLLILGIAASFLHLGNPLNAFRAVTNLGHSWLSREILLGVLFVIFGGVFAIMQWRKFSSSKVRMVIAWIAAIIGLLLVYSQAAIYMINIQPAWNNWATPVLFFTTTFLLGCLAIGAAFIANYAYLQRKEPGCADVQCGLLLDAMRWIAVASIIFLGIELVVIPIQLLMLAGSSVPAAIASAALMYKYGVVLALRLVLVFIGAGILALFLFRNASSVGREKIVGILAYSAFALVLISEVLGRYLFYAAHIQIGL